MKNQDTSTRTGFAIIFAILGLLMIAVGLIRVFNSDAVGWEIAGALALFGLSATFAHGFLSTRFATLIAASSTAMCTLGTYILPT